MLTLAFPSYRVVGFVPVGWLAAPEAQDYIEGLNILASTRLAQRRPNTFKLGWAVTKYL